MKICGIRRVTEIQISCNLQFCIKILMRSAAVLTLKSSIHMDTTEWTMQMHWVQLFSHFGPVHFMCLYHHGILLSCTICRCHFAIVVVEFIIKVMMSEMNGHAVSPMIISVRATSDLMN